VLPSLGATSKIFSPDVTNNITSQLVSQNHTYWEWTGVAQSNQEFNTWYLAGTLPNWQGTPLALVILIEGDNQSIAQGIGRQLIQNIHQALK